MYPSQQNPINGVFVKQQAQMLGHYYEVRVVATYFPARPYHEIVKEEFPVHRINFPVSDFAYLLSMISYRWYVLPQLRRIIHSFRPDLVHVHDCRHIPELLCLAPLLRKLGLPHYLTVHNNRTHPHFERKNLPLGSIMGTLKAMAKGVTTQCYEHALRITYRNWTHIFTVNEPLRQMVSCWAGKTPVSIIGNAIGEVDPLSHPSIDLVKRFLQASTFKVISAGNLKQTKGFDLLLKAIARFPQKGLRLVIIGDGEYRSTLENEIAVLGIGDQVLLTGRLENQVFRNLLPLFDAFVLPSYSETFGIVYLEAMAAGLPVVGVKGQGIDGIIQDGIQGLLVRPRNVEDIVASIQRLVIDREFAASIAQRGKQLVNDQYRLEQLCDRLRQVYEER